MAFQYEVLFVDYGFKQVLTAFDLAPLPRKFVERLPLQAIQCRLHNVKPSPHISKAEVTQNKQMRTYLFNSDFNYVYDFQAKAPLQNLCLYEETSDFILAPNIYAKAVTLDVIGRCVDDGSTLYEVTFNLPSTNCPVQSHLLQSGLVEINDR